MRPSLKKKFLIVLIGILIISFLSFYQDNVKNFFYSISQSFQKNLWEKGDNASGFIEGLFKSATLKRENEELGRRNRELLSQIVSLQGLEEENKILREALNAGVPKDFNLVLADLISKDSSEDLILIDKGLKDGLDVGMPVITSQKVILGKISEVYENSSRVILISHPQISFPAQIQDKGNTGIVKGGGNLKVFLEKVSREPEIKENDLVITTSLGGNFPKELLIGKVEKIQKSDIESFQKIELASFLNIGEIKTVFVITNF